MMPVKLSIEPTQHFFMAGEVMVRMWQGSTEDGTPVVALVAGVCVAGEDIKVANSLTSIPPPTPEDQARWAKHMLARIATEGR